MKEGNSTVERPDVNEWSTPSRPIKSSRGKCLCGTLFERHDCGGYEPVQELPKPAECKWLSLVDNSLCNYRKG